MRLFAPRTVPDCSEWESAISPCGPSNRNGRRLGRVRRIERITGRYVAADGVAAYAAGWPSLRTIVTIHPTGVRTRE